MQFSKTMLVHTCIHNKKRQLFTRRDLESQKVQGAAKKGQGGLWNLYKEFPRLGFFRLKGNVF